MAVFENYPYTNLHNLNLDKVIEITSEIREHIDDAAESATAAATSAQESANSASNARSYRDTAVNAADRAEDARDDAIAAAASIVVSHRIVCIGDSYAEGYSIDGNNSGWPVYLRQYMNIATADFERIYYGGIGFVATNDGKNFANIVNESTISSPETVTDVIFAGGYNDRTYTEANIVAGINTALTNARTKFPNAKYWIGFIGKSAQPSVSVLNMYRAQAAYMNGAHRYNARYMNGIQNSLTLAQMDSEKKHPNANGNQAIARGMRDVLEYGSTSTTFYSDGHATLDSNLGGGTLNLVNFTDNNYNELVISLGARNFTLVTPITNYKCNGTTNIPFATIPNNLNIWFDSASPFIMPCGFFVKYTDNNIAYYKAMPGAIYISDNVMTIRLESESDTKRDFLTLPQINYITFVPSRLIIKAH